MGKMSSWKMILLGFQHVCVMYGGAVAVPLMIGPAIGLSQQQLVYLISFDLVTCGIVTWIQVIGGRYYGIKLPALMAVSFVVVEPVIAIGKIHSITGVLGAVIVSGVVVTILAQFFGKIVKYFPPLVTGSVVLIIGTSLMPVAMNNAAGGAGASDFGHAHNLLLAVFTLICFLILNHYLRGFMKTIAVLISMVIGSFVGAFMGLVDVGVMAKASWFTMVTPFYFGMPTFQLSSILAMSVIAIIIMIESVGVFMALGEFCDRKVGEEEIKKGLRAEGIGGVISGILNSFNHSTFSQNVGLVFLTGVKSRYVVITAGGILILLGLMPKVAALTTMIPKPVLGGAMIPMFGMLISAALRMILKSDLTKTTNQLIVAVGVGVGLAVKGVPDVFAGYPDLIQLLFGNGVVMGSIMLFVLNLFLNGPEEEVEKAEPTAGERDDSLKSVEPEATL
ncbi:nucleobase:cation symporter-2 family protein [Kroppenstedtia eburnea]|uniref:Xanthine permease n=1 Tax=Kroppenstedtia eburnea TaxID=714067 RepID=A0A1N7IZ10_9BACL|nr:nucleobase:cation symporter-2 family protein [Kroppenstedtia eburnea]QKI82347.1 purine permease [Kroppenstedtia eburnea]SIS42343.1 xanthine permease [Kroppenstedtia eburnea]